MKVRIAHYLELEKKWNILLFMGMFDEYQPAPSVVCPFCDGKLLEWQGKSGPCALFVWRQNVAAPIEQKVDDDCRLPAEKIALRRLPHTFDFYPSSSLGCRFCPRFAIGQTENSIWTKTILVVLDNAPFCAQIDLDEGSSDSHSWMRSGELPIQYQDDWKRLLRFERD